MSAWQKMSHEKRELSYNPKKSVPEHEKFQDLATESALRFRNKTNNKILNIKYGKRKNQKLDIFFPKNAKNCPVQVYFHGGYWVSRDKFDHSHLAIPAIINNIIHVSVNYDLCPYVSLDIIVIEALECIHLYGGKPTEINLIGHSAGAHLVAMILNKLPTFRQKNIKSAALLSGIYSPIIAMYLDVNDKIKLNNNLANETNVFNYDLSIKTNILVIVGENEPEEWKKLSQEYINWLKNYNIHTKLVIANKLNHFTIVRDLSNSKSFLSKNIINLVN